MENELVFSEFSEFPFWMWELDYPAVGEEVIDAIPISTYEFYEYYPNHEYLFKGDVMFDGGELKLDFWPEEAETEVKKREKKEEEDRTRKIKRENINFEQLAMYFRMPINKAAKELKVGVTLLKRRCRELNIPRWPHRKMKSLDALIQNVKEQEGLVEEALQKATVDMLEEERRLMENKPRMELEANTKQLRQACFKANYKRRKLLTN